MEQNEILSRLCYYDKRNPDGHYSYVSKDDISHYVPEPDKCMCDNCFNGRTKLAEEILRLQEVILDK